MHHALFVGHFDTSALSFKTKVTKALDLKAVEEILRQYCDRRPDGSPFLIQRTAEDLSADWAVHGVSLGRIGNESVLFKGGYLICPWLGPVWNRISVRFVCNLHDSLGLSIYVPDDARFVTPHELLEEEREHDRYIERCRLQSEHGMSRVQPEKNNLTD